MQFVCHWSDQDGRGDTDGAAFIDNVWVWGDSERYAEDFETGTLDPAHWSLPNPDGVIDQWHMVHDTDPPYEGGDGGDRTTCTLDSSTAYRARPESGYPAAGPRSIISFENAARHHDAQCSDRRLACLPNTTRSD